MTTGGPKLITQYPLWKGMFFSVCILALSVPSAAGLEKDDFNLETTEDLLMLCSVQSEHGDYSSASYTCRGFIEGVAQYHDGVSDNKHLPRLICYPEGTTLEEGRIAFVQWGERNRSNADLMSELPVKGLVRALVEKYPCQQ